MDRGPSHIDRPITYRPAARPGARAVISSHGFWPAIEPRVSRTHNEYRRRARSPLVKYRARVHPRPGPGLRDSPVCLELHLSLKLQGTRCVLRSYERAENARGRSGGADNLTERAAVLYQPVRQVVIRLIEIRVVKYVVGRSTDTEHETFADSEVLGHAQVHIGEVRAKELIAPLIAEAGWVSESGIGEAGRVHGSLSADMRQVGGRHLSEDVTRVVQDTGTHVAVDYCERQASAMEERTGDGPVSKHRPRTAMQAAGTHEVRPHEVRGEI